MTSARLSACSQMAAELVATASSARSLQPSGPQIGANRRVVRLLECRSRCGLDGRPVLLLGLFELARAAKQPASHVGRDRREPLVALAGGHRVEIVYCFEGGAPVPGESERICEGEPA